MSFADHFRLKTDTNNPNVLWRRATEINEPPRAQSSQLRLCLAYPNPFNITALMLRQGIASFESLPNI
jgi:hypothetical protein